MVLVRDYHSWRVSHRVNEMSPGEQWGFMLKRLWYIHNNYIGKLPDGGADERKTAREQWQDELQLVLALLADMRQEQNKALDDVKKERDNKGLALSAVAQNPVKHPMQMELFDE